VNLPGDDHLFFVGDIDALLDEIEEFLSGARSGTDGEMLTMTVFSPTSWPLPSSSPESACGTGRG
jgi:hypothetical protein